MNGIVLTDRKNIRGLYTRKHVIFIIFFLLFLLVFVAIYIRRQPLNVILLTVDACNPAHLGCYGYERDTTPFLSGIANNTIIFKNTISTAPWTSPGLISLFTGLYPSVHGVDTRGQSIIPSIKTIFNVFKDNGYRVPDLNYLSDLPNFSGLGLDKKEIRSSDSIARPETGLLTWIKEHRGEPFFIWYHYRFLHLPYKPTDEFTMFLDERGRRLLNSPELKTVQNEIVIPFKSIRFSNDQRRVVTDLYDGEIREFDRFIKSVHDTVKTLGLLKNTLVVITADHGEELLEHGFIGHASTTLHATLYDEVIHIPFILYAPSYFKEKIVIEKQVRQIDIIPTILDIVGLDIPKEVQGKTLVPLIKGKQTGESPPVFSESVMGGYQSTPELEKIKLSSIRTEDWKLIRISGDGPDRFELFHLTDDPGETINLVSREIKITAVLKKQLVAAFEDMQLRHLELMKEEKTVFDKTDISADTVFEKPEILLPSNSGIIRPDESGEIRFKWTGNDRLVYVVEYNVGEGWRNLKGKIAVHGTTKAFGPLPSEVIETLPYWNPYRIRVSPYGQDDYWSEWTEFNIGSGEMIN